MSLASPSGTPTPWNALVPLPGLGLAARAKACKILAVQRVA
ncbi:MAG: hypothetical protein V7K92_25165 [Nostoc sp.]